MNWIVEHIALECKVWNLQSWASANGTCVPNTRSWHAQSYAMQCNSTSCSKCSMVLFDAMHFWQNIFPCWALFMFYPLSHVRTCDNGLFWSSCLGQPHRWSNHDWIWTSASQTPSMLTSMWMSTMSVMSHSLAWCQITALMSLRDTIWWFSWPEESLEAL